MSLAAKIKKYHTSKSNLRMKMEKNGFPDLCNALIAHKNLSLIKTFIKMLTFAF